MWGLGWSSTSKSYIVIPGGVGGGGQVDSTTPYQIKSSILVSIYQFIVALGQNPELRI